jgi:hypothetical protein
MVSENKSNCPKCGGLLRYFDRVQRIVRTKNRKTDWIKIRRLRCTDCGSLHRELPEELLPYKQYEAEVIRGVLEGFITCETLGFEDYPCELTMFRWMAQKSQILQIPLWRGC